MFSRAALVLAAGGLLVAALFFGGASDTDRLLPIGLAVLFVAGGLAVAALMGLVPLPRVERWGLAFFGLLAGFVLWSGLSVEWSIAANLSWDLFNRELAYLGFAVVGLCVGALLPDALRVVASGLALALGAVVAWALAGKVFPTLVPEGERIARLRSPVGYWNVLALLAAIAVVLGLWLATRTDARRAVRVAGAVLVYGALVAVVLTYSRSGVVIAVLVALAWLAIGGAAFESIVTLAVAGAAAVPVLAFAFARPGISDDGQAYATRVHDGALFAPVLLGGALAVAVLASLLLRARPVPARTRRLAVAASLGAAAAIVCAALVVLVVRAGGPGPWIEKRWDEFSSSTDVGQSSGRLTSLSSSRRWTWWQEAWRSFEEAPIQGRGAGTFKLVNVLERPSPSSVTQPHNLFLQGLSDTGVVGFALLVGAIAAAALMARATIGRARGPDRTAAIALAIGAAAYVVQSAVDVDWDFVAVSAPLFFWLGVLSAAGARPLARPAPAWALGAAFVACAGAVSFLSPWLAVQKTDDAEAAVLRGDYAAGASEARAARSLNSLAVEPLFWLGVAETLQLRYDSAESAYVRAVRLQSSNPQTWYELGKFELDVAKRRRAACLFLGRAVELDRFDPQARALRDQACKPSS